MTQNAKPQPYQEWENRTLMECWDRVGSVVLISNLLNRSESSIQTQASRLGLPRRERGRGKTTKHAWTQEEIDNLDDLVAELSDDDGAIPIAEVARQLGRTVDAVVDRLLYEYDDTQDLLRRFILPPSEDGSPIQIGELLRRGGNAPAPRSRGKSRGSSGWTRCLSCGGNFYSEDKTKNRICNSCRRFNQDELDLTPYSIGHL